MADKQISFSIQIDGNEQILKNLTAAQKAVKQLNKELKETEDQDVYAQKEKELIKAKAALGEFRKEQKNQIREFKAAQNQAGSYEDLNAQLVRARQEFKKLGAAQRNSADGQQLVETIDRLDKELKDLDKSIGQSQRLVGNYREEFTAALDGVGGQFGDVIQGFKGIGEAAGQAGTAIGKAFIAFQAVQLIVEAVGAIDDFVDATREAQRQVAATFGTLGEETDAIVIKVQALAETFDLELDESLQATNALVQQFGVSAEEATDLLADGLASAANQSEFLGRATDDLGKLSSAGIDASQAIGLIAETTNKGINVDVLSEGIISLRENAQGTADAIENAFGEEKAAQIAEAFKKEPIEALKLVAAEQKKLDQNSKESAELIANVFKGVGEENIKSVQAIADLTGNLEDLKDAAGEGAQRFDALRQANEDFAAAQVEVSNGLKGVVGNTEAFTTNLKTGLLKVVSEAIKIFKPLIDSVKSLFSRFKLAGSSAKTFEKVLQTVTIPLKIVVEVVKLLVDFVSFLVDGVKGLVQSYKDYINQNPKFVKALEIGEQKLKKIAEGFQNLSAVFAGIKAVLKQTGENISNFFEILLIDLKVFGKRAEQAISFGDADKKLQKEIDDLKEIQKGLLIDRAKGEDAFNIAYQKAIDERIAAEAAAEKLAAENAAKEEEAAQAEQRAIARKGNAEARKEREKEEQKRLEELRKAQKKFTEEQAKIQLERSALLLEVAKRIRDNEISLLEDTAAARRATIEAQYADELEAAQNQLDELAAAQEEREQEAIKLFGENSQQVIALRQQQAEDLETLLTQTSEIEQQALRKRNKEIITLEKDLVSEQQAIRETALNDTIASIDFSASLQLEKLKQLYAKGEISQEDFNTRSAELEQERLQDVIASYDKEIAALEALRAQGVEIDESYYDNLVLNSEKAKTQLEKNAKEIAAGQTVIGEGLAKTIGEIGAAVQQGIGQIDQLFANINAKEIERIEARRAAQDKEVDELQERLSQASGLQRVALQQQVDAEIKEQKRLEKEQEAIEKREAERQKRFAIAQALINGALAITNILATVPKFDFGLASALQIGAAIASTAAQVAVISSQQFARGGILDGASHAQGGIKTPFGELEGGEAVINKRSTAKFKPLLSRINEAGGGRKFAAGGVLTAPIVAPTSAESELNQFTAALAGNISAISQRVDNIKVTLNTDEEQREEQDRQENINIATLTTD